MRRTSAGSMRGEAMIDSSIAVTDKALPLSRMNR
jgi:hypothetical protein